MAEHRHSDPIEALISSAAAGHEQQFGQAVDAVERAVYWTSSLDPVDAIMGLAREVADARNAVHASRSARRDAHERLATALVHDHDLDPTCRERTVDGRLVGECVAPSARHALANVLGHEFPGIGLRVSAKCVCGHAVVRYTWDGAEEALGAHIEQMQG